MVSFYDFFLLDFGTVPTMRYVFCFSLGQISVKYLYYWIHIFMIVFLISWIPKYQNNVIIIWCFCNQKWKKKTTLYL